MKKNTNENRIAAYSVESSINKTEVKVWNRVEEGAAMLEAIAPVKTK